MNIVERCVPPLLSCTPAAFRCGQRLSDTLTVFRQHTQCAKTCRMQGGALCSAHSTSSSHSPSDPAYLELHTPQAIGRQQSRGTEPARQAVSQMGASPGRSPTTADAIKASAAVHTKGRQAGGKGVQPDATLLLQAAGGCRRNEQSACGSAVVPPSTPRFASAASPGLRAAARGVAQGREPHAAPGEAHACDATDASVCAPAAASAATLGGATHAAALTVHAPAAEGASAQVSITGPGCSALARAGTAAGTGMSGSAPACGMEACMAGGHAAASGADRGSHQGAVGPDAAASASRASCAGAAQPNPQVPAEGASPCAAASMAERASAAGADMASCLGPPAPGASAEGSACGASAVQDPGCAGGLPERLAAAAPEVWEQCKACAAWLPLDKATGAVTLQSVIADGERCTVMSWAPKE